MLLVEWLHTSIIAYPSLTLLVLDAVQATFSQSGPPLTDIATGTGGVLCWPSCISFIVHYLYFAEAQKLLNL